MNRSARLLLGAAACAGVFAAAQVPGPRRDMEKLEGWRYAHRGLHDLEKGIPENTLPAFERAFAGSFGAELDVHLTADDRLVVIHDSRLQRLCGVDLTVEEQTYDSLRCLGILGTGHHAPLFSEVLEVCSGRAPLIVEIKTFRGNCDALCRKVAQALDGYSGPYCIESFDPKAVRWFRENRPNVIRGQLSANFMAPGAGKTIGPAQRFAMTNMLTNFLTRPDFVAYKFADSQGLSPRMVCDIFGAKEVCWTIDTPQDMETVEARGGLVIFEHFIP